MDYITENMFYEITTHHATDPGLVRPDCSLQFLVNNHVITIN